MADVADWGLFYAAAGIRVFPVKPGAKSPSFSGWQTDATVKPDLIHQYFRPGTDRNIGLVMGESVDAWDIEADHISAFSTWLYEGRHTLPDAPIASTARGGVHILTAPTGVDGTRNLYLDGKHIGELKSRGGFILACPSEFQIDKQTVGDYAWVNIPPRLAVPVAPDWLLALLERPVALRKTLPTRLASPDDVVAVLGRLAGSVAHAAEGTRNNYLYWAIRRAIEEGIPVKYAVKAMRAAASDAGLEDEETEKTIESAVGAESVAA